ncbi:IS3 family transposase [Deinococcus roseus]|uniref:Transposase n=1 Tax=Deinococcus roseus TaxID=392414 RepID=A0ABQ2DM57_9DEIO|nr:IS3 family transposase [Deinococcus roseus]GGJ60128.1 transposase [Deinococcus roseus]
MKCQFIETHLKGFALNIFLRVLNVKKETYFAWKKRGLSERQQADQRLATEIQKIHQDSKGTYGAPRVKAELNVRGQQVSRQRITRLMQAQGLKVRQKRKFRVTTRSRVGDQVFDNVLDRQFTAAQPDQKWCTDLTYLPTFDGWLYLGVILDLYSRKVVGWSFGTTLETDLALSALQMAQTTRKPAPGLLHHSDRGCQYTSREYQQALRELKATCSMSRKGNCWDNAAMESFFATLKTELGLDRPLGNRQDTQTVVFTWIEGWYNRVRRHSALGHLSPVDFENRQSG